MTDIFDSIARGLPATGPGGDLGPDPFKVPATPLPAPFEALGKATGPAGQDIFDEIARGIGDDDSGVIEANMLAAEETAPDKHARRMRIATETGLPAEVVEGNEAFLEAEYNRNYVRDMLKKRPKLRQFFNNPDNAKLLSRDDLAALRGLL